MKTLLRHNRLLILLFLAGLVLVCAPGCQSLPRSGFDPSGQRLFETNPFSNCPLFNRQTESSPPVVNTSPQLTQPQQSDGAVVFNPQPAQLPGDLGAARTNPAVPNYGSTATPLPPGTQAVTTALVHSPQTGTNRPAFADTGGYALPAVPVSGPAVIMTPREQIAPVGSEVVLIASNLGHRDRLITNEKIEWALEGAGTLEKIDTGSLCDILFLDCVKPKKVTERYAVTKTSNVYQTIDRGTAATSDDIHLLRGQTWVSVNSMREGTTHVTAFAPNMADWTQRTDAGIIHWVDAQWVLPRLAIAPVGESRVLTTTVLRATNGQPRQGWIVRYEILNGPSAGFDSSFAQVVEVATDFSGQATTVLTPNGQQSGTNTIGIQIIRPAGIGESTQRVTVGSEMIRQTWAGNPNILLSISGPTTASLGQELPYVITAENRSSAAVQGVIVLPIPPLASYIRSTPSGTLRGETVHWNVNLMPNQSTSINVFLRQGTAGPLWLRPEFFRSGSSASVPSTQIQTIPTPQPVAGTGATVFSDTSPSTTGTAPAVTFPPSSSSWTIKIEPHPLTRIVPDDARYPFTYQVRVTNSGTTEARNVKISVPLASEFRNQKVEADCHHVLADGTIVERPSGWVRHLEPVNFHGVLDIPVLSAGESALFFIEYPTISRQGYEIKCIVQVDGRQAAQETERIVP